MEHQDTYRRIASEAWGIPYDEVTENQRQFAKTQCWAVMYSMDGYDERVASAIRLLSAFEKPEPKESKRVILVGMELSHGVFMARWASLMRSTAALAAARACQVTEVPPDGAVVTAEASSLKELADEYLSRFREPAVLKLDIPYPVQEADSYFWSEDRSPKTFGLQLQKQGKQKWTKSKKRKK